MSKVIFSVGALALICLGCFGTPAQAKDKIGQYEGYYYPESVSQETYVARAVTLPHATWGSRIGFVTGMTAQQLRARFPPQFAIFDKGDEVQELITVVLNDTAIGNVFCARTLLAQLTAEVRTTQSFQ
ncbi:MAG: molybdopterin-guanine dinucleotide biosynthesis protein A [Alphaproteobacteria bacterium]|nr:molybdopterin-guanine dinucleotide biosynthesis protein A [Alphaproteobacteria bacterium]